KRDIILGSAIAYVIGSCFVLVILTAAYNFGRWLAPYIGWASDPSVFGLLTAIGFVWLYTYREFHGRCDRLSDRINQLDEHFGETDRTTRATLLRLFEKVRLFEKGGTDK